MCIFYQFFKRVPVPDTCLLCVSLDFFLKTCRFSSHDLRRLRWESECQWDWPWFFPQNFRQIRFLSGQGFWGSIGSVNKLDSCRPRCFKCIVFFWPENVPPQKGSWDFLKPILWQSSYLFKSDWFNHAPKCWIWILLSVSCLRPSLPLLAHLDHAGHIEGCPGNK